MPGQTISVFVSYSHADASLVAPVVRLLRVNKSLVFQDADGINPGARWRDAIAKALSESNLVVVFWCDHALRSNEVSSEWRAAIEQGKDLLPLLLDGTPLPSELSAFQWIDFRGTVGANHNAIAAASQSVTPRRRVVWSAVAAAAVAVILTSVWTLTRVQYGAIPSEHTSVNAPSPLDNPSPPLPGNASTSPPADTPPKDTITTLPVAAAADRWILLLVTVVVVLGAGLLGLRQWRRKGRKQDRSVEASWPRPGTIEHRIAAQLEAEIIRRTATTDGAD